VSGFIFQECDALQDFVMITETNTILSNSKSLMQHPEEKPKGKFKDFDVMSLRKDKHC